MKLFVVDVVVVIRVMGKSIVQFEIGIGIFGKLSRTFFIFDIEDWM